MERKITRKPVKTKKHLIVLILRILETESDKDHPISQTKIAEMIADVYKSCDRKTVGRNIHFLQKMGYPIVKGTRGFYMGNKLFTKDEVEFIISSVRDSQACLSIDKSELCERLYASLTRYYNYKNKRR